MAKVRVVPRSLTEAYKRREGDFSPNLVGLQFTDGSSLFTFGNFQITTNLNSRVSKDFILGGEWSDYYDLQNLNVTETESKSFVSNEIFVRLNFNPNKIDRYVYFGSFYEYARVTLEQIIQKWKGGIYLNPTLTTNVPVNTVLSFSYNSGNDVAEFLIAKSVISNPFELIVDDNFDFSNIPPGEIYNLSLSYKKYVISNNSGDFNVVGYTGSTTSNPYIRVQTKGNPFPLLTATTFGQLTYLLKPNTVEVELFFQDLKDFEKILLNRLTTPIYTATFDVPVESDGVTFTSTRTITWPTSDGYNIDINTRDYGLYVENLLEIATNFDNNKTDLVSRRFVSESIHEFDTNGGGDPVYGMKVTKLLKIYGREFDEVKKYIDGISFANVVTYDKLDNTSDELIKIMAKTLGFDVLLTVTTDNFDLLEQITTTSNTPFSGYSRSLSAKELDVELWRRLIINAWWLYKSKGTRKVFEFFFNLFKIPECMLTLNEYVYLSSNRVDVTEVYTELQKIYDDPTFSFLDTNPLPIDDFGFPLPLTQTNDNYFQNDGFWYNNGTDITTGNNPHIGPYDMGTKYFNQFKCFVPNFNDYLTGLTTVIEVKNYFTDYDNGNFGENTLPSYPNYGSVINSVSTNATVTESGYVVLGDNEGPTYMVPENKNSSLKIKFNAGNSTTICEPCNYDLEYGTDGFVYKIGPPKEILSDLKCCQHYSIPSTPTVGICYWCSLNPIEVCDTDTYVSYFTTQELEDYAISLGWDPNSGQLAGRFINSLVQPFFDQNGCLLLDATNTSNIRNITNAQCCQLRGGEFIEVNGGYFCVKQPINPCLDGVTINSHVLFNSNQELLSQECCVEPYYWYTGGRIYNNLGQYKTFPDNVGLTQAGVTTFCSQCPTSIIINSEGSVVNYNNQTEGLTSTCCTDYGYTYNSSTGKCSQCPVPTINTIVAPYELMFPSSLTDVEACCSSNNGQYYSYNNGLNKCWSCPPTTSYLISQDGFITIGGADTTNLCCKSYAALTNEEVIFENGRCKRVVNNNIVLTTDDLIYVTDNGNVYTRTLLPRTPTNSVGGDYATFDGSSDLLFTLPNIFKPTTTGSHSITHTNNKLFVLDYNGTKIGVYNVTLNPWTITQTPIEVSFGRRLYGLFAIDDNNLVSVEKKSNGEYWVVDLIIGSNNTITFTDKFRLTKQNTSGIVYFDGTEKIFSLIVTTTNKIIINYQTGSGIFVSQYNYGSQYVDTTYSWTLNTGALEMSQRLDLGNPSVSNAYGIYMYGPGGTLTQIYSFNAISGGESYKLKDTLSNSSIDFNIYNLTLIGGQMDQYYITENYNQNPIPKVLGVSQLRSLLSNNFLLDPNALVCTPQGPIPCS